MKAIRYSGLPVNLENLKAWQSEWTLAFDELKLKHGSNMLDLQTDLAVVEKELAKKYPTSEDWSFVKTQKAMKLKIEEVQAPILIAKSSDNSNEILYVIMDQGLG